MFSMLEMPADNLGTSEHFHRKQVCMYICRKQNRQPILCNKQARWPSTVVTGDLLPANVSKLRSSQWCSIVAQTLTLRTALSQRSNIAHHLRTTYLWITKDLQFCFQFAALRKNGHLSDRCDAD